MEELRTIDELLQQEPWNVARELIAGHPEFADARQVIDDEFGVWVGDVDGIRELPEADFRRLKKRLIELVQEQLQAHRDALHEKICLELNYCQVKDQGRAKLVRYIAGALDVFVTNGGVSLAILLLEEEFLKKLCGCK